MKLPLMAALAALTLYGCAHQNQRAADDARAGANEVGGSGLQAQNPTDGPGASDQQVWDATEQPRTRDMQRRHGLDFYEGTSGYEGTGGAGAQDLNADANVKGRDDCAPGGTGGAGTSGIVGEGSSDKTMVSPRNLGAKFDITPDAWKENKGIGYPPSAPSTGTPPVEGSGGAGGVGGGSAGAGAGR